MIRLKGVYRGTFVMLIIFVFFTQIGRNTFRDNDIKACKRIVSFAGSVNGKPRYNYKWDYKCKKFKKKNPKNISEKGIKLIKKFEGFHSNSYRGLDDYNLTIGYGHVIQKGESIKEPISKEYADELLRNELKESKKIVTSFINKRANIHIRKYQFDALVSLVFNTGPDALSSMESPTFTKLLKSGNWNKNLIVNEFGTYCLCHDASGNVFHSKGLWRRHINEGLLFVTGKYKNYSLKKLKKIGYSYPYN